MTANLIAQTVMEADRQIEILIQQGREKPVEEWQLDANSSGFWEYGGGPPCVGLDVEWKPNMGKGEQRPAAILQVASSRWLMIFDLIWMGEQEPAPPLNPNP